MNESQFMALRAELQEANSLNRQILTELKHNNELLVQLTSIPAQYVESPLTSATKTAAKKGK